MLAPNYAIGTAVLADTQACGCVVCQGWRAVGRFLVRRTGFGAWRLARSG